MDKKLTPEQILCLQWWGCTAHDILNADNTFFEETARIFGNRTKDFLDNAASLLEKQELLGIHTYAFHHTDFPDDLKQTGDDCPPLIHLLGNKALLGREAVAIVGARAADKKRAGSGIQMGSRVCTPRQNRHQRTGLGVRHSRPSRLPRGSRGNPRHSGHRARPHPPKRKPATARTHP